MRTSLFSFVLLCTTVGHAQNWALLNPAYKYNYSNDGSDTISNQIFVTHIDTLGVDSFRYELNRIGVLCDTCTIQPSECFVTYDSLVVLGGCPQYLNAGYLTVHGSNWYLGQLMLDIDASAGMGSSWDFGEGLTASVTSVGQSLILGEMDSIKVISLSNGSDLILSLDHGLLSVPVDPSGSSDILSLVGIEGLGLGVHYPTIEDLFNYQTGDILQYTTWSQGDNGDGTFHTCNGTEKLTILDRNDLNGYPIYTVRRVGYTHCTGMFGGPFTASNVDTVPFDPRPCESSFVALALKNLWPGAVGYAGTNCTESYPWNAEIESFLNENHHNVVRSLQFPEDRILRGCTVDSSVYTFDYGSVFTDRFRYEEGIGLLNYFIFFFEGGESRDLTAWSINGVTSGSITADDILLSLDQMPQGSPWSISPNPVMDELVLQNAPGGGWYSIVDLPGRGVTAGPVNGTGRQVIQVSSFPDGAYILNITTPQGGGSQRFIVAH